MGRCLVLPGRQYTPDGPLLFFAAQAALMRGWDVRQVWWEAPERGGDADEIAWVGDQLDAALEGYSGRGTGHRKVAGNACRRPRRRTRLRRGVADARCSQDREAAAPLLSYPASQFVVIGSSDPFLSQDVLDALPGTHRGSGSVPAGIATTNLAPWRGSALEAPPGSRAEWGPRAEPTAPVSPCDVRRHRARRPRATRRTVAPPHPSKISTWPR